MSYKSEFLRACDAQGIRYRDVDENRVSISYRGENTNDITVVVIFDNDGDGLVALRCWSFGKATPSKRLEFLECCNSLNTTYRWVKFYIDNDGDIAVSDDAVIDISSVGPEVIQLVHRMVGIYDDAYLELMKVKIGI